MTKKRKNGGPKRRDFLKVTAGGALAGTLGSLPAMQERKPEARKADESAPGSTSLIRAFSQG